MFGHMSIHHPRPGTEDELAASMHRFRAAALGKPGLVDCFVFRDARGGRLVGLALWTTRAAWREAIESVAAAVKDDPFDEGEEEDPQVFSLEDV